MCKRMQTQKKRDVEDGKGASATRTIPVCVRPFVYVVFHTFHKMQVEIRERGDVVDRKF